MSRRYTVAIIMCKVCRERKQPMFNLDAILKVSGILVLAKLSTLLDTQYITNTLLVNHG